ncbi:MAG: nitronate monooxygenase [Chitinophagales bacterium]
MQTVLTEMLGIQHPVLMAPMFLVSNVNMIVEAANSGIAGCIPALNYRTEEDFRKALMEIQQRIPGKCYGINLIGNKSNIRFHKQLEICVEFKVPFIITSLGSPQAVIEACKPVGTKVFCDVIDLNYAKKVEALGADAIIAVNNEAGGHAGNLSPEEVIPLLSRNTRIPVISAGGVGNKVGLNRMLALGACGVSVGSPFIASNEAPVNAEYKNAIVQYGAQDIVRTTKISGTPCTVINTPFVKETGLEQNWLERTLASNKTLKKWVKMLTYYQGMKMLEKAAFSATYNTYWCAGQSIEHVHAIRPVKEIVKEITGGD